MKKTGVWSSQSVQKSTWKVQQRFIIKKIQQTRNRSKLTHYEKLMYSNKPTKAQQTYSKVKD